jgi:hypothetical protein
VSATYDLDTHRRRAENLGVVRRSPSVVARLGRRARLGGRRCALAAVLAVAACRGAADPGPPCSAVGARFLDLARFDLGQAKVDDATRRAVTDQLPAMRDALVQACADGRWSAAARSCLVAAADHVGFEGCEQRLSDEQRRDLDRANREPAGTSR